MIDVLIIGAGVVGSAIARELAKYRLSVHLVERDNDVAAGASKANSGIVHGAYVGKAGSLKAHYCRAGGEQFESLDRELHFGYRRTGALTLAFDDRDLAQLEKLRDNALAVGHAPEDAQILNAEETRALEPHLSEEVVGAFYVPSVGVASPYEMTIALAENAVANGVTLHLKSEVVAIERVDDHFIVQTKQGVCEARYVINAAGLFSDRVAAMVGTDHFEILPRRGQYVLFHKSQAHLTDRVLFQTPTDKGKGVLVTTTYHGNLMIGPDAEDTGDPEDLDTTEERLKWIIREARRSIPDFDLRLAITTFSGVRARPDGGDFIIEMSSVPGFVNVAGIESPGFTASPAIAERVAEILGEDGLALEKNEAFNPNRPAIIRPKGADFDGTTDEAPPDKHIICRCEQVTEAEILDALDRPLPVCSLDAIKRRTRAGMGACQGAFCGDRVRRLLAREQEIPAATITKRGGGSTPPPTRVPIRTIRKFDL